MLPFASTFLLLHSARSLQQQSPPRTCPVWTVSKRACDFADAQLVACSGPRREIGWLDLSRVEDDHVLANNLLVDIPARRCGVATSLMTAAEDVGREWGLPKIRISAKPEHAPAWRLYRELGYSQAKGVSLSRHSKSVILEKFIV